MIKPLLTLGLLILNCVASCWGAKILCQKCYGVTSPDQCNLFEDCDKEGCYYEARKGSNGLIQYYAGCGSQCYWDQKCCYTNFCNGRLLSELAKTFTASGLSTTTTTTEVAEITTTQTPKPSFQLTKGGNCYVCSGETCGLPNNHYVMRCPDEFPYCMNIIQNDHLGNKLITKRCSSFKDCQVSKQLSEGYPNCSRFDAAEIYTSQFECSFCCETSFCNFYPVPARETILMGK